MRTIILQDYFFRFQNSHFARRFQTFLLLPLGMKTDTTMFKIHKEIILKGLIHN